MKLLPLACFAVSAAQSGDYDYGAVDTTEEDDRHYGYSSYGNYDDYGNKKNKWSFGQYQGKVGGAGAIAVALNCWPANFDKDTLMKRMPTEANPAELHAFGPLHLYGSEMDSRYNAGTNTGDPGLRAGMGGHYHYGHSHSDAVENTAPSEWVHYHSARHAGCLYEIPDFSYNADSWNKIFHLYYYNGYYNTAATSAAVTDVIPAVPASYTDPLGAAISFDANWVHFFNAHVLVSSGGHGASTSPDTQTSTNSIKLVMANPQYEGLGWLNFVATFARSGIATGTAYTEFADSTIVTLTETEMSTACNAGPCGTYTAINDASTPQQTQGTTGNFYYDAWMGTWELRRDTADVWNTKYTESASGTIFGTTTPTVNTPQMAVSSFPHNELGKDFRFNMRVLLEDSTDATRIMYYFYKINTITITFPNAVAYALVHDGREDAQGGTTHDGGISSTGNSQGDGVYSVSQNSIRDNIIPPLDLGSHMDSSFGEHVASTDEHHRITGYLSTAAADVCITGATDCADFCRTPTIGATATNCAIDDSSCAVTSLEEFCSTKFYITGLLNTYSERLGGQRGTYQEIWVQLQYAFRLANTDVDASATEQISSPFPYLHFMASEIVSIAFKCDTINVDNGNTCDAFVTPTTHDFGWGG